MKQSLGGLIENAAEELESLGEDTFGPCYASGLRELLKNLTLVRNDPALLKEFFDLYVE